MGLKSYIEKAEIAAGSQKALGLILGQAPSTLRAAKAGICGLPTYACVMIADLIDERHTTIIAASELVTEKKVERRAFWEKKLEALAAGIAVVSISVSLFVTPSPAEANQINNISHKSSAAMYIM